MTLGSKTKKVVMPKGMVVVKKPDHGPEKQAKVFMQSIFLNHNIIFVTF
jgi:hypothetical protein